jgi:hypothetical protein
MRPMQIFEKPQQLYSNVIEITNNNQQGHHSNKYFPHTTIDGTNVGPATTKKNGQTLPKVQPIAIINTK